MALVVLGLFSNALAVANGMPVFQYLALATLFAFLLLAVVVALRQVVLSHELNANRLFGAVCAYLMLGTLWAIMYSALSISDPGSFSGVTGQGTGGWGPQWMYYSFVTITTLGYGDILPVSVTARVLAFSEAIFGVFYMAVLVAALVGAYAGSHQDKSQ